ncbi:MAG: hypothetical protein COA36_01410 [Desulfotalea sp.]|nr:MAG: hypothetical protein COA36_01410 [Desulfotalea sp.]
MIGKLLDKCLKKKWTDEAVLNYVGEYQDAFITHSTDVSVREKSASGGTTTSLLIQGLKSGDFEGVIVCKTSVRKGRVRARFFIATTVEDILAARGSKYVEAKFLAEVLPLIRGFEGRLAIVGLPCDITALKRFCNKYVDIANKIVFTIALFCGHNSRIALIDEITARIERESQKQIVDYRFRVGNWRGQLEAVFDDGTVKSKPTKYFNDYQNLFFFCQRKCMSCNDHYGYDADMSVGDVWLFRLRSSPIKHTGVIVRKDAGIRMHDIALAANAIDSSKIEIREIMDGQSRIGPSHYNVSARHKAGRLFGVHIKDTVKQEVAWHEYLNALITVGNMCLSEKAWGEKVIFGTPRPILKLYLYFKKALESL